VDHGEIIADHQGWSDDSSWQLALEGEIRSFLDIAQHANVQRFKENKP
jgi:hypothetical protein